MHFSLFTKAWFEQIIQRLVLGNPLNRLNDFGGMPIFDKLIIGVADGDDPLFGEFLTAVSPRHLIPRNFLKKNTPEGTDLSYISVVSWALPFTEEVRSSNQSGSWPSRLYSLARNNGGTLNYEVRHHLTEILQEHGKVGASPVLTEEYDTFRSTEYTFASSWSERHVAYAAGLGRFGLNGCLITPIGVNVRFGSIITNLPLEQTEREKGNYRAACLEYEGKNCNRCIERCPANAISKNGLDKAKCYAREKSIEERFMKEYESTMKMFPHPIVKSGKRRNGYSLGCALCQCSVPCESEYPELLFKKGD
ncbi:epoxyqueuosine reductase [bacterium]|nr:epoxyqueuosine reductase [bacterium]